MLDENSYANSLIEVLWVQLKWIRLG